MIVTSPFEQHFARLAGLTGSAGAHGWQIDLGSSAECCNRLIRIPTGMGKTFGVLAAWSFNRLVLADPAWPRRLVWCLPMRTLVEQVAAEVAASLARVNGPAGQIAVHVLMGGADTAAWQTEPERDAVLVGTQDMLLSRAMNRGYGAGRARWPMEFGLLNHDCLWVMDEVQLMDVGLATSAQLQAFSDAAGMPLMSLRPRRTWWMSATLQPAWLAASPDTQDLRAALPPTTSVPPAQRVGPLWDDVHKPVSLPAGSALPRQVAEAVWARHLALGRGAQGPTLVVLNQVARAMLVFAELRKLAAKDRSGRVTDLRLVHSRFRSAERAGWRTAFLDRRACGPGADRIVVATQVVEAGVDMSSALLVTDLAPWPSLVQRFGRAARWGGQAEVWVVDTEPKDDKAAAPYSLAALDAARQALRQLHDVSPRSLQVFEEDHPEPLSALYPFNPGHLLLRQELDDLFDTAPDLSGMDVDISRYIRSGEERDVQVFWRDIGPKESPADTVNASRDELCTVPFLAVRDWLCVSKSEQRKPDCRAWVWDWLDGRWRLLERRDIYPGQTLLVAADVGGYDPARGWDAQAPAALLRLIPASAINPPADSADRSEDDESLSAMAQWQTIAFHGRQVGREARALVLAMLPDDEDLAGLFDLAGRWHDAGKAHAAFQGSIKPHAHGPQIAKAPEGHWHRPADLYRMPDGTRRQGFRHELASTLALLALMRRCRPDHAALLGPWRELLQRIGQGAELPVPGAAVAEADLSAIEREVLALDADGFDLLLYLVCSHHGKVRMSWQASPADQAGSDAALRIRGVRAGDLLPAFELASADGERHTLPAAELVLAAAAVGLNSHTGRGWTERVLGLLQRHGPFALAWMEAVMRAADQRASRDATLVDPALQDNNSDHGLATKHPPLARPARGRENPSGLAQHPGQRGAQHGLRGRTGGSGNAGGGTRPPAHATRYVETRLGTLSYLELAPHLALAAAAVESAIEAGDYDGHDLHEELVLQMHQRLCGALTPQLAGWRRSEVLVGSHTPPPAHLVPQLMREYALDLQARLAAAGADEALLEALAFAEGQLLSIHPFADFNGRVCRLFMRWLLRRLDLPRVLTAPVPEATQAYLEALRAGDRRDWRALTQVWRQRFSEGPQA